MWISDPYWDLMVTTDAATNDEHCYVFFVNKKSAMSSLGSICWKTVSGHLKQSIS
jgi:hypothetical protein